MSEVPLYTVGVCGHAACCVSLSTRYRTRHTGGQLIDYISRAQPVGGCRHTAGVELSVQGPRRVTRASRTGVPHFKENAAP